jgi:hypothetical protein
LVKLKKKFKNMMFEKNREMERDPEEREEILSKLSAFRSRLGRVSKSKKVGKMINQLRDRPEINQISRQIAERRNQRVPIQDRYMLELKRRERRLGKLKQQLENEQLKEDQDLTFSPNINPKSRNLSRQRIDKNVGKKIFFFK